MSIAQNIRHYRELQGLTLDQFSAQTGISIADCIKVEAGQRPLTADEIASVCNALHITSDVLCADADAKLKNSEGESVVMNVNELKNLLGMMKE